MQLIQDLSSGFSAAPNGTARVYILGTSTPAEYFNDFEGASPVAAGTTVVLDAQGAAEVYVNQLVTLIVKDAAGTTVSDNVPASAAPTVEVRSFAFSGTDPVSGVAGAGEPTTLQAVLDLALVSFDLPDWKIDVAGVATNLHVALAGVLGLVFNVKDPTYGAVGNGVADDRGAIALAIAAAAVNGGIVYFPSTDTNYYRVTLKMDVPANVNLVGAGSQITSIQIDSGTAGIFQMTPSPATVRGQQVLSGLTLEPSQSNTSALVAVETTMPLLIDSCKIGGLEAVPANGLVVPGTAGAKVTIRGCVLEAFGDASLVASSLSEVVMEDTTLRTLSTGSRTTAMGLIRGPFTMRGCTIDATSITTGTFTMLDLTHADVTLVQLSGNKFLGSATAIVVTTAVALPVTPAATVMEDGSYFSNINVPFLGITPVVFTDYPLVQSFSNFGTRDNSNHSQTQAVSFIVDGLSHGNHFLNYNGTGTSAVITATDGVPGMRMTVTIRNDGTMTLTPTWASADFQGLGNGLTQPTGGSLRSYDFVYQATTTAEGKWFSANNGTEIT